MGCSPEGVTASQMGLHLTHPGARPASGRRTADPKPGPIGRQLSLASACQTMAVGAGTLWILSMATATGVTAELFPTSLAPFRGQLYLGLASLVDVFATIALLLFIPAVFLHGRSLSPPDCPDADIPTPRAGPTLGGRWLAASCSLLVILLAVALAIQSASPSLDGVLSGAVVVQRGGFTQAALNGLEQQIPSKYNSSDFSLYFFASGWAQDLGQSQAAIRWDRDLLRSSAQVGSMAGFTAALSQYRTETGRAVPGTLARFVTSVAAGHWWQPIVVSLLLWDTTARLAPTVAILRTEARLVGGTRAVQLKEVISMLRNQRVPR